MYNKYTMLSTNISLFVFAYLNQNPKGKLQRQLFPKLKPLIRIVQQSNFAE